MLTPLTQMRLISNIRKDVALRNISESLALNWESMMEGTIMTPSTCSNLRTMVRSFLNSYGYHAKWN